MRVIVLLFAILAAPGAPGFAQSAPHRLLIHVDGPQAEMMREALHNAALGVSQALTELPTHTE